MTLPRTISVQSRSSPPLSANGRQRSPLAPFCPSLAAIKAALTLASEEFSGSSSSNFGLPDSRNVTRVGVQAADRVRMKTSSCGLTEALSSSSAPVVGPRSSARVGKRDFERLMVLGTSGTNGAWRIACLRVHERGARNYVSVAFP